MEVFSSEIDAIDATIVLGDSRIHHCTRCYQTFSSRNKLYDHIYGVHAIEPDGVEKKCGCFGCYEETQLNMGHSKQKGVFFCWKCICQGCGLGKLERSRGRHGTSMGWKRRFNLIDDRVHG